MTTESRVIHDNIYSYAMFVAESLLLSSASYMRPHLYAFGILTHYCSSTWSLRRKLMATFKFRLGAPSMRGRIRRPTVDEVRVLRNEIKSG